LRSLLPRGRRSGSRVVAGALCGIAVAAIASASIVGGLRWRAHWAAAQLSMLKAKYRPPSFVPFPASDPFSRAKADLGRIMFFDPRFSRSGRTACATCHQPSHGWTDGRGLAVNDAGEAMDRRTPSLIDIAWIPVLGWDGKFPDLESVTFGAITAKSNMDLSEEEALARVRADPQYTRRFAGAFPDHQVSAANMAAAIATFERLIVSIPTTPFDRWIAGDETAINPAAKKGFLLARNAIAAGSSPMDRSTTSARATATISDGDSTSRPRPR
jgi:cytochrome c peroxidase